MNILVSGGWGYKNLGDDAILIATIKLLKVKYPNANIIISTYSIFDTNQILKELHVNVIRSIQCILFGNFVNHIFCSPEKWSIIYNIKYKLRSFYQNCKNEISYFLLDKFPELYLKSVCLFYPVIKNQFENTDLFLMSGGGYLNESKENNISHLLEIILAKKSNIPIKLIGQTIGPFENLRTKRLMQQYLPIVDTIVVRDIESRQELIDLSIPVNDYIIPDLALYDTCSYIHSDVLTIIPFFGLSARINDLASIIKQIAITHNLKIVITVSQLWTQPIMLAKQLEKLLKNMNFECTLNIPHDYYELQDILGNSKIVISQNLHGLIMAYRSGTKVVSLNDRRKFKTFFEVINSSIPCFSITDFKNEELINAFEKVFKLDFISNKDELSSKVATSFNQFIN